MTFIINAEEAILAHYGTPRHSGRYPYGSGGDAGSVPQHSSSLLDHISAMKAKGMSEPQIAKGLGISTTKLRAQKSLANNERRQADITRAQRLKDHGYSPTEIGRLMGRNESSIRSMLAPGKADRLDVLQATSAMVQKRVDEAGFVDVGIGVERHLGISKERLATAVSILEEQGYKVHSVQVPQLGTTKLTTVKVLSKPGTTYPDVKNNRDNIVQLTSTTRDNGKTWGNLVPPLNVSSKRVQVRYGEDGGDQADGVIYVRRGKKDLALGDATYAQVRIAVDGTHYMKGMAMYRDDMPDGVDLIYNTPKSSTGNKLDAMKPMQTLKDGTIDPENPFGSVISRQITSFGKDGKEKTTSAMNIVNEEGTWGKWSKSLSSQMLSKQQPNLAKAQLAQRYLSKKDELEEIMRLTNPAVKKRLLDSFADDADSSAVHLKAAALPRQAAHVILPIESMRDTEIYAPKFKQGERVVLIRYPHGGIFEIPELVVNNRQPEAKRLLGPAAKDAVGINANVAKRLSGADFDGDTVLVIPNNHGKIKTQPALEGLKDFDPQRAYKAYPGMPRMSDDSKQLKMGDISNLITDMTIKGANNTEIARAVRHSMVVIDAAKHNLNWKQSEIDNGIAALKDKYQPKIGSTNQRKSTLISQAKSPLYVDRRALRPASDGGPIDPKTGKLVYVKRDGYVDKKGNLVYPQERIDKLAATDDALTLSSGKYIEKIYADHSNRLKALANEARKESLTIPKQVRSPAAAKAYAPQVKELNDALDKALRNAPLERQAQILGNAQVNLRRQANPNMDPAELKKVKGQALAVARARVGAGKDLIDITDDQWKAIQAGAISGTKLKEILKNSDLDRVKELATPRTATKVTPTKKALALSLQNSGHTAAEIAEILGISVSTLTRALEGE